MGLLRGVEGRIEGLFEGVFGRAFRTNVQPVELARKLAKEMDEHRSVSVSRVYVPNEYNVYLAPGDRAQFASYEGSLVGELQEYLVEHARREGYALLTPPRVLLQTDRDLAVGEFGIATRIAQPDERPLPPVSTSTVAAVPAPIPTPPLDAPAPTVVVAAAEVAPLQLEPEPEQLRERATLSIGDRVVPIVSDRVVLGRSRECDIRIEDGNASRRHCEVVDEGADGWSVVDLGSTNGTEVNGRRIDRTTLSDGDRITIGATDIVFGRSRS